MSNIIGQFTGNPKGTPTRKLESLTASVAVTASYAATASYVEEAGEKDPIWVRGTGSGSAVLSGSLATATGRFAVAVGYKTTASGEYSRTEGYLTIASGSDSHAEGEETVASGSSSHAEGGYTVAYGEYSHAEGANTEASGSYSHAEGTNTNALGYGSHAEGSSTAASNDYEHAQGRYNATASGQIFSVGVGNNNSHRKNAISIITGSGLIPSASIYVYGVGTYDGTNPTPGVNDLATVISGSGGEALEKITWSELKSKRDDSQLTPGQYYEITDYTCTTVQENTQAAGHDFDVIVLALAANKLSEEARAIQHEGDTYFVASKLEAWKLWYCLDNDTTRFAWADSENGKGVIYRMIDEWGNDCPYDFKNIQFKRKISLDNGYPELDLDQGTDTWVFTFAATSYHILDDLWSDLKDGSLESPYGHESDDNTGTFHDNVIGKYIKIYDDVDEDYTKCGKQYLNDNVFFGHWEEVGSDDPENTSYYYAYCSYGCRLGINCYGNTFGENHHNNTFGDSCYSNTFGIGGFSNTFGDSCFSNTFGDSCYSNTFGNNCYENTFEVGYSSNTFGDSCNGNTFGDNCINNIFGNDCNGNTFGNTCHDNTFGDGCFSNTFGDSCYSNTFGSYCYNNVFGNSCSNNTFGNACSNIKFGTSSTIKSYCTNNIIENGNQYIYINVTRTTSANSPYRNVKIAQGVNNSTIYKTITDNNVNQTFQTVYQPENSQTINV